MNDWSMDIDILRDELPRLHVDLFHKRSREAYMAELDLLAKQKDELSIHEVRIMLAKIIASLKDAHTSVTLPVNLLCPIKCDWFLDGIFVIATSKEYKGFRNAKIIQVGGVDINTVIETISTIISYENRQWLRSLLPHYLMAVELLFDLCLVDNVEELELGFELPDGTLTTVSVKPVRLTEVDSLIQEHEQEQEQEQEQELELAFAQEQNHLKALRLPLYRKNTERHYWWELISQYSLIYFKYNACRELQENPIDTFLQELVKELDSGVADHLVVDLRNNRGGDSTLLEPLVEYITQHFTGALYVIIGRDTFSSALLNAYMFRLQTNAVFVGEPTGGKPNCHGEIKRLLLPGTGLAVSYSTRYYRIIEDDSQLSMEPDIACTETSADYINGVDPSMEYIISCINGER